MRDNCIYSVEDGQLMSGEYIGPAAGPRPVPEAEDTTSDATAFAQLACLCREMSRDTALPAGTRQVASEVMRKALICANRQLDAAFFREGNR